jgi:putative PIN family toxin of toxin-antitoxin system
VRIVLDTNVALSALLWRGTPYRLLEAIRQQPHIGLVSSAALIAELADVLTRPKAAKRLGVIEQSARTVLVDYLAAVELVEPISVPRVVPTDADDDQVIAAAVTAQATLIVSGDSDLLSMESYQGMPIVTAANALQRIAAG